MDLNITSSMTPDQILIVAHEAIAIPALIYAWIGFSLILLFVGLFTINSRKGSHPYQKFMIIWIITVSLSGILVLFLSSSPVHIQSIKEFILSIIG